MGWKVTVRHGPQVAREKLDSLEQALELARARIAAVLSEGELGEASTLDQAIEKIRAELG